MKLIAITQSIMSWIILSLSLTLTNCASSSSDEQLEEITQEEVAEEEESQDLQTEDDSQFEGEQLDSDEESEENQDDTEGSEDSEEVETQDEEMADDEEQGDAEETVEGEDQDWPEETAEDEAAQTDEVTEDEAAQNEEVVEEEVKDVEDEGNLEAEQESVKSDLDEIIAEEASKTPGSAPILAQADEVEADEEESNTESNVSEEPAPIADTEGEPAYIVVPGDTLGKVAYKIYRDASKWKMLAKKNGIEDPSKIYPGDIIRYDVNTKSQKFYSEYDKIEKSIYTVRKGDTLSKIAIKTMGRADYWRTIWKLNVSTIEDPNIIHVGQDITYILPERMASFYDNLGISQEKFAH